MKIDNTEGAPLIWGHKKTAAALGVSERTLWALVKRGEITVVRLGARVLYDPKDVEAFIQSRKTVAAPTGAA